MTNGSEEKRPWLCQLWVDLRQTLPTEEWWALSLPRDSPAQLHGKGPQLLCAWTHFAPQFDLNSIRLRTPWLTSSTCWDLLLFCISILVWRDHTLPGLSLSPLHTLLYFCILQDITWLPTPSNSTLHTLHSPTPSVPSWTSYNLWIS